MKREKRARSIIRTRNVTIRDLRGDLSQLQTLFNEHDARLNVQMAALVAERDSLVGQVTALRGTVPQQVAAVAAGGVPGDLQTLVLNPARAAWACGGTVFLGQTFFSYDFDNRAPDGSCF